MSNHATYLQENMITAWNRLLP